MKLRALCLAAALTLLLSGCSLEREYSVVEPHENQYWESTAEDILRAESYQDLVNTLLLLVEQHEETGTIEQAQGTDVKDVLGDVEKMGIVTQGVRCLADADGKAPLLG